MKRANIRQTPLLLLEHIKPLRHAPFGIRHQQGISASQQLNFFYIPTSVIRLKVNGFSNFELLALHHGNRQLVARA